MKTTLLPLFILLTVCSQAQTLHGVVLDRQTGNPIAGAHIVQGLSSSLSSSQGRFDFQLFVMSDSIGVYAYGYKFRRIPVGPQLLADTLTVYMQPLSSQLTGVEIRSRRNYKVDSLNNRNQFAKQFNYKGPSVMDAFTGDYKSPFQPASASINLLTLAGALTKKMSKEYKFKQKLLDYEQENYIDDRFNEDLVTSITKLKGDSLHEFMRTYRPSKKYLETVTRYDLLPYIKESYDKFVAVVH